ncbi:MAG: FAD-dependent oxidoreductase [Saprospiraceae bacterium]
MNIHIIGGGVIGFCAAYYLRKQGYEVTLIDKGDFSEGCSFGNAGMVVPSHFIPMATPGVIAKGLKWMFNSSSPFYIRPRVNTALIQWLWEFYKACDPKKVEQAMPVLRDLNEGSKLLYRSLSEELELSFDFEQKGLIMLYRTAKGEKEEIATAEIAAQLGVSAQLLSASQVQELEQGTRLESRGGIYYPGDAHLSPHTFMKVMKNRLKEMGVDFLAHTPIIAWETTKDNITHLIKANNEKIPVDQVVLATGSWSEKLLKKLSINMLIQDGKGYSITLPEPAHRPNIPSILSEDKVAITPMGKDLRFGGTLELGGMRERVNNKRVQGILSALPQYYPELSLPNPKDLNVWLGFRPCSPDGLPYIGRTQKFPNLIVASGHAMMGMSLGPITGKMVAEIVQQKATSVDNTLLLPERYA